MYIVGSIRRREFSRRCNEANESVGKSFQSARESWVRLERGKLSRTEAIITCIVHYLSHSARRWPRRILFSLLCIRGRTKWEFNSNSFILIFSIFNLVSFSRSKWNVFKCADMRNYRLEVFTCLVVVSLSIGRKKTIRVAEVWTWGWATIATQSCTSKISFLRFVSHLKSSQISIFSPVSCVATQ